MRLRYSPRFGVPRLCLVLLALTAGLVSCAGPASASCNSANLCIPPVPGCAYTSTCDVMFPMGFEMRNLTLYDFTSCIIPQPGLTTSGWLECRMDVDLSPDAGSTWHSYQAIPTSCHMVFSWAGTGGQGEDLYTGAIDNMSASGGNLPPYEMLRESPIQNSTGTTSVLPTSGDYHIDSFFDVFVELSLDDGMTWYPDLSACHIAANPVGPTPVRSSTWGQLKVLYR